MPGGILRQYSSVDVEVSHQQSSFNLCGGDKMVSNFQILRPPDEFSPSRLIVVNIPFFVTPGSGWVGFLVVVVVVVGVPVVVISPVFLLSNKLPQTVYILFPLNGPDEDQQESHRKGDSTYCSFVGMGGALWSFLNGWF